MAVLNLIKVFRKDEWLEVDVDELKVDDLFALNKQLYVMTDSVYYKDGKPNVPAKLYESSGIVIDFSEDMNFVHMAMDCVFSDAHDFGDGTMIISNFDGENTNVYSPRLPRKELNEFCEIHQEKYLAFLKENEGELEKGLFIQIEKFWLEA